MTKGRDGDGKGRKPYHTIRLEHPGHFIREWREYLGWSQEKVSDLVGVTMAQISKIERGKSGYRQETLEQFAKAFGCEPIDLLRPPIESGDDLGNYLERLDGPGREHALAILRAALGHGKKPD